MYGKGNTGPAREVWHPGDRVRLFGNPKLRGTVAPGEKEPTVFQTGFVWVRWDDGLGCWTDPNHLDVAR